VRNCLSLILRARLCELCQYLWSACIDDGTAWVDQSGNSLGNLGSGGTGNVFTSTQAPNGYFYALLMQSYAGSGPTANGSLSALAANGWLFSGAFGPNALGAGKISGGATTVTTAGDALPAGTPNQFLVVGWSANEGTSWAIVANELQNGTLVVGGYIGASLVGTGVSATSPSEQIFGGTGVTAGWTLNQVNVVASPEPGTLALAGLGGLSLLAFRRKK